ncbi:MAG: JAB domain-containing protein [Candidatus Cryosericum sp.]
MRQGFLASPSSTATCRQFRSEQELNSSKEDIDTTNKITQALKCVGALVLDHIIVGRARHQHS